MKTAFFLLIAFGLSLSVLAQRKNETQKPFVGSWKFSRQSTMNDFQKIFDNAELPAYQSEYFTFEPNGKFVHSFLGKTGDVIKSLKGSWKSVGDKIKISYAEIKYNLTIDYFFLDKDLVLGQNFNHVIFTKDNTVDAAITMK